MSYKCSVCGRAPSAGKTISHSHKKSNRRFLPNLQRLRIIVDGKVSREYVCTTCIHSGRIKKAI